MQTTLEIKSRYQHVRGIIEEAASASGRSLDSVRLIVVTKNHPSQTIVSALEAGILDFGENYAEEAVAKIKSIGPICGLQWHMIGHIQSRKAEMVAENFNYIHSLDSYKLAAKLNNFALQNKKKLSILLECNVSGEESKYGYPAYEPIYRDQLLLEIEKISQLSQLEIHGLMTMPPLNEDAEKSRPHFSHLRNLRDYLALQFSEINWKELSMGTSADYSVAVQEGATLVRVGTAILGPRVSF